MEEPIEEQENNEVAPEPTEADKLKLEMEILKTQLAKAEIEKQQAQKAILSRQTEIKPKRTFKSLMEDIE